MRSQSVSALDSACTLSLVLVYQDCRLTSNVAFVLAFCRSPRRTIATAQLLYHRFHLFFPLKDFPSYHEPVLATLYVSAKLHDTLKKPREIVLASYGVRFPELLGGKASLGEGDVDVNVSRSHTDLHRERVLLYLKRKDIY